MFNKVNNIVFCVLFLLVLFVPFLLTDWNSEGVSVDENRNLADFPSLTVEGRWNEAFTAEFDTWFMDHMGLREELITANAKLQYRVFNRMLTQSELELGRNGDLNYAPSFIIDDFAHVNLYTEEELAQIGRGYQVIDEFMASYGIPFYYVQCFDKHSIYPEQFVDGVKQLGDVSKTDQLIAYLEEHTTVNTVSMKPVLLENKAEYEVFSNWGDPTHWSPRGAYIGYRYLMERINEDLEEPVPVLQESDYEIHWEEQGMTVGWGVHQDDMVEQFTICDPKAQKSDVSVLGSWSGDYRHSVWKNPEAGNDLRVLLMCDSYFNEYIVDDIAESFAEVWVVWGDYTTGLAHLTAHCNPDIVIYESAERVDRSHMIIELANMLKPQ